MTRKLPRRAGDRIGLTNSVIVRKQIRPYNLGVFKEVKAYLLEYEYSQPIIEEPRLLMVLADEAGAAGNGNTHPTKLATVP